MPSILNLTDHSCDSVFLSIYRLAVESSALGEFDQCGQLIVKPVFYAVAGPHGSREHRSLAIREETGILEHYARDPIPIALRAIKVWWQVRIIPIATLGLDARLLAFSPSEVPLGFCKICVIFTDCAPLVGVTGTVAEAARADMEADNIGDVSESDVAEATHQIFNLNVKRSQKLLAFFI